MSCTCLPQSTPYFVCLWEGSSHVMPSQINELGKEVDFKTIQ